MTWRLWKTLVAPDPSQITQVVAVDQVGGDLYGMQAVQRAGTVDDLWITRYVLDKPVGTMRVTGGISHGYYLTARDGRLRFDLNGARVELPWSTRTWTSVAALKGRVDRPVILPRAGDWLQGEVTKGSVTWRLYGVPYKVLGPSLNPDRTTKPRVPARLDVLHGREVIGHADLAHLGRVGLVKLGPPIGGRLEPEGLSIARLDGHDHLVVGVTTGGLSKGQKHQLYVEPITWPVPVVSLPALQAAAKADPGRPQGGTTAGSEDDVRIVEQALQARGLLEAAYAGDGAWGTSTLTAYAAWQRHLGYTGADADGKPGKTSLTALGQDQHFDVYEK